MPRVERVLEQLRRKAQEAKTASGTSGAVSPMSGSGKAPTARNEAIRVAAYPELLKNANVVSLNNRVLSENRVRGIDSTEAAGEAAYKMLRTRVLQRMRSNGWHKLAITSPRANAGKSLTSINLAISLAHESNQNVILVDADLRKPRVAEYLGLSPEFGVADHLSNGVPLEKVIVRPSEIDRLYILPSIDRTERSSELLASREMALLTQKLVATSPSTIVIFDMPPLLEADDMLTFAPHTDGVLFVVAQSETRRVDLEKSNELFNEMNLLGVVLNKSGDNAKSEYY